MEGCSIERIMSLRDFSSLFLRVLRLLLAPSRKSMKKIQRDGHVQTTLVENVATKSRDLPQDILMEIFALLEIPDLIRAGSVCSSWHSAYTSLRSLGQYKRHQTPCLLYTSESAGENVTCLYSLAEKRIYKLILPDPPIRTRHVIGSAHGWLVTADERSELHLVNPVTGEQISLPPVITIEQVNPIFDEAGVIQKYEVRHCYGEEVNYPVLNYPIIYSIEELRGHLYFKAFVFSDLSTGSYIVVLIHEPEYQLSFARAGDIKWTWLPPSAAYRDCIYMDGLLYALTATGGIDAFDLTGPTITWKIVMEDMKNYIFEHMYIVKAPWGDVLQVWREADIAAGDNDEDAPEWDLSKIVYNTLKIILYKVDMAAKKLVEINSLHDHVLFLGHNQSQCLNVEEYPQLKANCVYCTDDQDGIVSSMSIPRDIGIFNLANNSLEEIASPQIWSNWPAPIWITPNFTIGNLGLDK